MGGVLMRFTGRMGCNFGSISGEARGSPLDTQDLRLVMALKLDSAMMCGIEIWSSRQFL
jgi:hypothetical protein